MSEKKLSNINNRITWYLIRHYYHQDYNYYMYLHKRQLLSELSLADQSLQLHLHEKLVLDLRASHQLTIHTHCTGLAIRYSAFIQTFKVLDVFMANLLWQMLPRMVTTKNGAAYTLTVL